MTHFLAQVSLGTKSDIYLPLGGDNLSTNSSVQFIQMLIVLGITVFAIKYFLPKFIFKINPGLQEKGISSFQIEESASFAGGKLFVVKIHEKKLLLSATAQNINYLMDLTGAPVKNENLAFFEVLDSTKTKYPAEETSTNKHFHPEIESLAQNSNPNEIQALLDRISRFTGT